MVKYSESDNIVSAFAARNTAFRSVIDEKRTSC